MSHSFIPALIYVLKVDVRINYKGKYKDEESLMCPLCGEVNDNTEHLLECNTEKYTEADLQNTLKIGKKF